MHLFMNSNLSRLVGSAVEPNRKRILYSTVFSVVMVGAMHILLFNIPFILLALPLFYLVPEFGKTGKHVEWWFFGPMLKSPTAFVSFLAYYFIIVYLALYRVGRKTINKNDRTEHHN